MRLFRFSSFARGLLVPVLLGSVAAQAAFELSGELPASVGANSVEVLRESLEERGAKSVATGSVVDGRFRLQVDAEPGLFTVKIGEQQAAFVAGEGQTLRVAAAASGPGLQVSGSPDQAAFLEYEAFRTASLARHVLPVREAIARETATGNEAEVARLTEQEVAGYRVHRRELNDFTLEKLRRTPALYAASLRWDGDYRVGELAAAAREFASANPDLEISRLLEARVAQFYGAAIGQLAPPLSGPAPDGSTVSLDALRGKYVLVDFWASWCSPCRIENRNYVELYRKHRSNGFEILAVSVDQDGAAWRAAIAKDSATWLQISDLSGWKTPLAAAYTVTALPASFLVDPEGRIVAKDVRGAELAALLEKLIEAK